MPNKRRRQHNSDLALRLRRLADALEAAVATASAKDLPALARALTAVVTELDATRRRDAQRHAEEKLQHRLQPIADDIAADLRDEDLSEEELTDLAHEELAHRDRDKRLAARQHARPGPQQAEPTTSIYPAHCPHPEELPDLPEGREVSRRAPPEPRISDPASAPAAHVPINRARQQMEKPATAPPRIRFL